MNFSEPPLTVSLESPPCFLCGGERFVTILSGTRDRVWWKPGAFTLAACTGCSLVQTRPRPTPDALGFYYRDTYSTPEARTGLRSFYEGPVGRLLNRYRLITVEKVRPVNDTDHIVDVGCSYGHFLQSVREARSVRTTGLDTDSASLENAVDSEHCTYIEATLGDARLEPGSVSIITFFECLEHDPTPVSTLQAARDALVPGGLVSIELPMWDSTWRRVFGRFWHPLFVPQHLVHFSRHTLEATVRAAGLEPVHHQTMLFPSELTLSLRGALYEGLFGPGRQPRQWVEKAFAPLWMLVFWLFDVPSQVVLRAMGQAGHQTLIARRPLN